MTTYAYDGLGRLTGKTYSDGDPAVSYTYDAAGRLADRRQRDGHADVDATTSPASSSPSSRRGTPRPWPTRTTSAGNRLSLSLDGQLFVTYAYDDASRLTSITRGSSVFGFGYDDVNRRTSMTYPNGVTTSYGYDDLNRLTSLGAVLDGTTPITCFGYTYDAAGNRLTKATPDFTENYGYDPLYRLTGVDRTGASPGSGTTATTLSATARRPRRAARVTTSSYNEKNQLTSGSGGGALQGPGHARRARHGRR